MKKGNIVSVLCIEIDMAAFDKLAGVGRVMALQEALSAERILERIDYVELGKDVAVRRDDATRVGEAVLLATGRGTWDREAVALKILAGMSANREFTDLDHAHMVECAFDQADAFMEACK